MTTKFTVYRPEAVVKSVQDMKTFFLAFFLAQIEEIFWSKTLLKHINFLNFITMNRYSFTFQQSCEQPPTLTSVLDTDDVIQRTSLFSVKGF